MKYNFMLIMVFVLYCCLACKEDKPRVIDGYFEIINTVVRDNDTVIPPERIESIHQIYIAYQRAQDNEKMYITCAIDICDILLTVDLSPKDLNNIESARAGLYVLLSVYP
jgi:hypothetical protein